MSDSTARFGPNMIRFGSDPPAGCPHEGNEWQPTQLGTPCPFCPGGSFEKKIAWLRGARTAEKDQVMLPARIFNARIERAQYAVDEALRNLADADERVELYREKCRVALENLKMPESRGELTWRTR